MNPTTRHPPKLPVRTVQAILGHDTDLGWQSRGAQRRMGCHLRRALGALSVGTYLSFSGGGGIRRTPAGATSPGRGTARRAARSR